MRYDLSPFYRSTVGFERLFDMLDNALRFEPGDNWPPYDIAKTGEDAYRITMAVAGFTPDEMNITMQPNLLVVSGQKAESEDGAEILHRGIAERSFKRSFELADHVKVTGARLEDGLLTIELAREVPEAMKPRRIEIQTGGSLTQDNVRRIETAKAA